MLIELAVRDLGVIEELRLVLGHGLTAVTGETGAGKTLVVTALELLLGGRADPDLVRPGADEAWVEGRFLDGGDEVVLTRAVPASGRSRAYIDGKMATATALAERALDLIDIHGQHEHQGLMSPATQRGALDAFAGIDLGPRRELKGRIRDVEARLAALGGDERARLREIELLRFQGQELGAAQLSDAEEDERLDAEETALSGMATHRAAAAEATEALLGDGGASDRIAAVGALLSGSAPLAAMAARISGVTEELIEIGRDLRSLADSLEENPERLDEIRNRRQLLHDLRRKYGERLGDVIEYQAEVLERLADLEAHEERAALLDSERRALQRELTAVDAAIGRQRREAGPRLAGAVEKNLRTLAMGKARLEVEVSGDDPGDDVRILLAANSGGPLLPLVKVASGGELARTMLAARLVLQSAAGTLVFDEVDAGIGGEAALAVGQSLARLASHHQVLVVTHLPQVAAFADQQVRVSKAETSKTTVATAEVVDGDDRVIELSRMLSGQPESATARSHAQELLASVAEHRGR